MLGDAGDQCVGHPIGNTRDRFGCNDFAWIPDIARGRSDALSIWIEPHDALLLIYDQQAPPDVERGRSRHSAAVDDRKLGRSTPDIDVENSEALRMGHRGGAGAV